MKATSKEVELLAKIRDQYSDLLNDEIVRQIDEIIDRNMERTATIDERGKALEMATKVAVLIEKLMNIF